MKIVVLIDNVAGYDTRLKSEHGLSCIIDKAHPLA